MVERFSPALHRAPFFGVIAQGEEEYFKAASSLGNEPRVLVTLRITIFRLSIAFVV